MRFSGFIVSDAGCEDLTDALCWESVEKVARPLERNNRVLFAPQTGFCNTECERAHHKVLPTNRISRPSTRQIVYDRSDVLLSSLDNAKGLGEKSVVNASQCTEDQGILSAIAHRMKLKVDKGKFRIDNVIDLHGYTTDVAYDLLADFIIMSFQSAHKCVLVITGWGSKQSGENALRRSLYKWLQSDKIVNMVLYYTRAVPEHGGRGAFYVLLRSKHKISKLMQRPEL
ncbi:Smr/MutS family protein [Anaplasma phagocytophilum]|uniref:Smr domain protein n=1 Tax=Anaplasma phagocytophilum str. CRT53-1 TaxID=1359157 RepID=A0A0F3Q095_ANAPH|nr:Smr/MutS family protein [Anaplasma phagocytophilum]KJV86045.1 smr domain protein [Anaplasma phagocytophilum str. CRT53-1]